MDASIDAMVVPANTAINRTGPSARVARSPASYWAKNRTGRESSRSQNAGSRLDSSLPRSRARATVWIAWNEAMATATATRNAQSKASCPRSARGIASSIVIGDHDRHDQAEQAADQAHQGQRPELAPDQGQGETDEPAQGRALRRECPVKDDGGVLQRTGELAVDRDSGVVGRVDDEEPAG